MTQPSSDESGWLPEELRDEPSEERRAEPSHPSPTDWLPESDRPSVSEGRDSGDGEAVEAAPEPSPRRTATAEWLAAPPVPSTEAPQGAPPVPSTEAAPTGPVAGSEVDVGAAIHAAVAETERTVREDAERRLADAAKRLDEAESRGKRLKAKLRDAERGRSEAVEEAERARGQASDQAASYEARIAELEERIEELERSSRLATERMVAATSGGKRDDAGRIELNAATVEGLRQVGLSITQAARLVSHREASGGFVSFDELDAVPGLPAAQRDALEDRVYVDPGLARRT